MLIETRARTIAKAASYRVTGSATTALLVSLITGRFDTGFAVGGLEALSKLAIFYFHERGWARLRLGMREIPASVIWLTGLPGAGKTTIATEVVRMLKAKRFRVEHLDGDTMRAILPDLGYTREERNRHNQYVALLAELLNRNNVFVVASFVSPYRENRDFARRTCRNFKEIHVATPLEECERRDVKGHYARARRGEIKGFTGVDAPYEAPENPELRIDTRGISPADAAERVIDILGLPSLR